MSTASVGRTYEWKCRKLYEAAGYDVIRAAASKGGADLIATCDYRILLIQVKKTTRISMVSAGAYRELRRIRAPWIYEVKRLAWFWLHKDGWHIHDVWKVGHEDRTKLELDLLNV